MSDKQIKYLFLGILCGIIIFNIVYLFSQETITVQVTDKERIVTSDSSYYLVFCVGEVFQNSDSMLFFKFNSSDIQGKLERGKTYKIKVIGFRVPFLSMYRNILGVY